MQWLPQGPLTPNSKYVVISRINTNNVEDLTNHKFRLKEPDSRLDLDLDIRANFKLNPTT